MKRIVCSLAAAAALALGAPGAALAGNNGNGNGMPSGPHYNLNIIGSPEKNPDMTGTQGHSLFVDLWGNTRINLTPDQTAPYSFEVTDRNGTDGVAAFQLPVDVSSTFDVFVRALGKPGGKATMQTCYEDGTGTWCLAEEDMVVKLSRDPGRPVTQNVSRQLLNVTVCVAWDAAGNCTDTDVIPLFSDEEIDYLWSYDNSGLRLAQLRFYPKAAA